MMNVKSSLVLLMLFLVSGLRAQQKNPCIEEVVKLEEKNTVTGFTDESKALYVNYTVKTTDWENQTIVSNVKVYRGKDNTHFYSEQGLIFQDEKDVFMVLPTQKLILVNSTRKELYNQKLSDDFYKLRRAFLDSCEVVRCESNSANPGLKTLELKVKKADPAIQIVKMIYEYNTETGRILSTKIYYSSDFKVKVINITYNDISLESDYKFAHARKYVLDKNNRLLPKYSDYELVDNRGK
jgi:hypothetical protein